MMTITQHLLGKLAEEGSEVAQIALKTQQFGLSEKCPGQPFDNAERTHQELDDIAPRGNHWPGLDVPPEYLKSWADFQHTPNSRAERSALFSIARRLS